MRKYITRHARYQFKRILLKIIKKQYIPYSVQIIIRTKYEISIIIWLLQVILVLQYTIA